MPERIQRSRAAGYRMPANTTSVARPSVFGNPFKIAGFVEAGYSREAAAAAVAAAFRDWLAGTDYGLFAQDQRLAILRRLPELHGKNLACFCPLGRPCHADVLIEIALRPQADREDG